MHKFSSVHLLIDFRCKNIEFRWKTYLFCVDKTKWKVKRRYTFEIRKGSWSTNHVKYRWNWITNRHQAAAISKRTPYLNFRRMKMPFWRQLHANTKVVYVTDVSFSMVVPDIFVFVGWIGHFIGIFSWMQIQKTTQAFTIYLKRWKKQYKNKFRL